MSVLTGAFRVGLTMSNPARTYEIKDYPIVRKTSLCLMAVNSPRMELGFVPGMSSSSRAPRNLRQLPQSSTVRPRAMSAANSLSTLGTPLAFCPTKKL